jgi:hypothetical protein
MRRLPAIVLAASLTLTVTVARAADELFVYPQKGQSDEQLDKDKEQCHDWAVKQTGVDPVKMADQTEAAGKSGGGSLAAGAGVGALRGAAGGDAAAGAVHGVGLAGLVRVVRARRQMEQQHDSYMQTHQEQQAQLGKYDRAYSACLEGRGYTVR